jgi:thiol-disulfide isomerase/thioredoxin
MNRNGTVLAWIRPQLFAMRTLLIALALLPLVAFTQSTVKSTAGIQWLSIEEAQARTKKEPRPLMVDVYTSWCGPCKMLDAKTFSDPRLAEFVNKHFYPVKFNAESGGSVTFNGQKLENPEYDAARATGRNGTHQLTYAIANVQGTHRLPDRGLHR